MAEVMTGTVPLFDPNRGYRQWHISEIYTGPNGKGNMVPNVDDSVMDYGRGVLRVIDVDTTTNLSQLIEWRTPTAGEYDDDDILLGIGPGPDYESAICYINKSVIPHAMCVDTHLHSYGSRATYMKVFLGTDTTTSAARVISAVYNQAGEFISENIPLILAESNVATNYTIKVPAEAHTNDNLADGEVVTAVFYNDVVGPVGRNKLLVRNTQFIRAIEASQRYVTDISLESPFLADSEASTIYAPLNLPIEALTLTGRVHYSDGSIVDVPINQGRMNLYGLENYLATIIGQPAPLSLVYMLSANESGVGVDGLPGAYTKGKKYTIRTTDVVGAYTVKLFVIPKWVDPASGWRLEYYLYNLDRGDFYYATPFIEAGVNSAVYNPTLYGVAQNLVVAVDLNKIDPRLRPFRHVQAFQIALMNNGVTDATPYLLAYDPGQTPEYGANLSARCRIIGIGNWKIDISQGKTNASDWLNALYYPSKPLYDPTAETGPLMPTHFVLSINGIRTEYPISSWDKRLDSVTGGVIGAPVVLEWVRKVAGATLQLGCSGIKIVHTQG